MRLIPSTSQGLLALLLLLMVSLQACVLVVDEDVFRDDLHRSRWRLNVIVYYGHSYSVGNSGDYLLSFDARNRAGGFAECNDYDAAYETTLLGGLSFRDIYSTDVACRGSLEDFYFESLYEARTYSIQGDALTIRGRGGDHVLYFYRD